MVINYKPKLFHKFNPNITHNRYIRSFIKIFIPAILLSILGYWLLGFFIDAVVERITPEKEDWLWKQLEKSYVNSSTNKILPKETAFMKKLFKKIPLNKLKYQYNYKVMVVKSPIANAYALPGGNIIFTSALLKEIKNPHTLLFILGHELGHFQNRDHLKKMGRDLVMTKLLKWTIGPGVAAVFARFSLIYSRAYSRSEELKADLWGLYLLNQAQGDIQGAKNFLAWLEKDNTRQIWDEFLSTHPSSKTRKKTILRWIQTEIYKKSQPQTWDQILSRIRSFDLRN